MIVEMSPPYVSREMLDKAVEIIKSRKWIKGPYVREFEEEFAKHMGTRHAVAVNSCTSALQLSLMALGVGRGDEVLVPSHTAFPTIEPIIHVGATPVFVDIDYSYTMNPDDLAKKVTEKSKAVLPVHLYGHPARMDRIMSIANANCLYVLEDCAQAHNAEFNGQKVGTFGDVACYSFFPSKNMSVGGDGGMVTTDNDHIANRVSRLRDHGRGTRYVNDFVGFNMRMNAVNAGMGSVQLKELERFTSARRVLAKEYYQRFLFHRVPLVLPIENDLARHAYHLYVVRTSDSDTRNALQQHLKDFGVQTNIHYPIPCHVQPALRSAMKSFKPPSLPVTEDYVRRILSLPMHPALKLEELKYVVSKINEFYEGEKE